MNIKNPKLIHNFLRLSAERFPEKTAVVHEGQRIPYIKLLDECRRIAYHLTASGVQKGDRIVLLHENGIRYIVSYYGILMAGGVVVSLNPGMQPDGLQPLLEEISPTAAIASIKVLNVLHNICDYPNSLRQIILTQPISLTDVLLPLPTKMFDDLPVLLHGLVEPEIEEHDLAEIIYTSGSTGKPKGVMLTHKSIAANTRSICTYLHLTENDIQMVVLPFFYVMGKSLLNTHVAVGGTIVINNKFAFPASVVRQMITEKVTGFSGVPSTFAYLLHRSPLAASRDKLTSLRYVSQAGGHMAKQIKLVLREALPEHTKIIIMYGATEASARLTWLEPDHFSDKIESIGKAIPGVTISIIGTDGNKLPANQIGEITASGDNIMRGYWQNEEETRKVLDYNGYHTGDLGFMDEEGFIYVTGRRDNQLKVGGHRVDPQEIEDAIMESNMLIEISVIGVPDQLLGNKLFGLAVPVDTTITENSILAFAAQTLPKHKVPSGIFSVNSLPKNANGKIDRAKCGIIIEERRKSIQR